MDEKGFIFKLWDDGNSPFEEVEQLVKRMTMERYLPYSWL